ncbi:hypothetical protein M9435_003216 [Picochlorum sp. BPE23]|nr:hypothetical protein M9435_003216 [Picochlorum sp. BPE23]
MRVTTVALVVGVFLFGRQAAAIPPPKCDIGSGVSSPDIFPYGPAEPGDCKPCAVKNCQYCLDDYSSCKSDSDRGSGCKPGYGLNSKRSKCLPCKGSKCGVCENNYKKCTRKVAKCNAKVTKTIKAKKVATKKIKTENHKPCFAGKPYASGDGYTTRFVALVRKNGVCVDCNSDSFLFRDESGKDFCYLDGLMRQTAVNAFKKKSKCQYPEEVSLTLKDFCFDNNRRMQFDAIARYEGKYCGKKRTIYVQGSTDFGSNSYSDVPETIKWTYAVE